MAAQLLAYPEITRIVTVETDFELGMVGLGRRWTQEMQSRLPVTSKWQGISTADMMPHTLRTRAEAVEYPDQDPRDANAEPPFDLFDFSAPSLLTPPSLPVAPVDKDVLGQCQAEFARK